MVTKKSMRSSRKAMSEKQKARGKYSSRVAGYDSSRHRRWNSAELGQAASPTSNLGRALISKRSPKIQRRSARSG